MGNNVGFRSNKVFENVPANQLTTIDNYGAFLQVEVTNDTAGTVKFYPNQFEGQGHKGDGIPIKAGQTRIIPMAVYNFKADGVVTVVAYRM